MQHPFRKILVLQLLVLALAVLAFERWIDSLPDRTELGSRAARIDLKRISLPLEAGPLRLAGAWELASEDPRFGGISALALDGGQLLALTDSGALIAFAKPGRQPLSAVIRELPGGPGDPRFKSARDSEALAPDPAGRGWWVAFENWNEIWLFDRQLRRGLTRIELGRGRWFRNEGIEGLAPAARSLLAFPERGDAILDLLTNRPREYPIFGDQGRIADATTLPDGRLAVIRRRPGPLGFSNSLGILERSGAGYRYAGAVDLPVLPLDNVEAVAAEPLANGSTRLWMMTDDNYHAPLRTLLFAYDLPPQRQPD